jgi:N-acetylated-alpha-linked acidic dipeptidase
VRSSRRQLSALLLTAVLWSGAATAQEASSAAAAGPGTAAEDLAHFRPERRAAQAAHEQALRDAVEPQRLRAWHDLLSSRPHVAGSAGDLAVVEALGRELAAMGLEVETQELWLYLPRPVAAELAVVTPERVELELQEEVLAEDPYSGHPELTFGWNAYSGSGEVTAEVVYANQGTKRDFARLTELGVDVAGKIVVARYGGNYRGYKEKFAAGAGAAGLVLYLDPEDYGYVRGLMWPEGGWANGSTIQRGSLLTLPYPGDPLTPFVAAVEPPVPGGAPHAGGGRLDPAGVDFPTIPVQPVGWAAAREILSRMGGPVVPAEWQGGLPFNYRLTGGPDLRVHLRVEQERRLVRTYNVVATLAGERLPEESVLVGSHHDAWSFGAGDPNAGSIVVMEAARVFAAAARQGRRPDRSLIFAHWGAEEQGIQGSVEWVEEHAAALAGGAVAYVNLDMAAMGPRFGAAATPSLAPLVVAASRAVESPVPGAGSVHAEWSGRGDGGEPQVHALGGGSDHVGFYGHLGVPSATLGGGGSPGVSYHTNYEDLTWYRAVVGDDYLPARMVTQVAVTALSRLAEADLLPLAPAGYGAGAADRVRAVAAKLSPAEEPAAARLEELAADAETIGRRFDAATAALAAGLAGGTLPDAAVAAANRALMAADRAWISPRGLTGRPWYRNLYAAPDADSGYAPWVLPELTRAAGAAAPGELGRAGGRYREVLARLEALAAELESLAAAPAPAIDDHTATDAKEE